MLTQDDIILLEKSLPFYNQISDDEKELIKNNSRSIIYRRGENIHSADNECIGVLLIKSGELRTYMLSDSGKEITLFRLRDDDTCILSASCLLSNITFDVFIDAEQETEILLISSNIFSKLMKENIHVENFALRLAADRFSDVMWAMEQILFMSFDRRLAVFLLDETSKTGADNLTLTHEQIAKYIGSAREVVSRMLNYFKKEGLVELHRGGVQIINKEKLRELVL